MHRFLFLLLLIHSSFALADGPPFHVVFDLDWTLLYKIIDPKQLATSQSTVLHFNNETYVLNDYAKNVIDTLRNNPDIKVSFFSAGSEERTRLLLQQIILKDGKTAYNIGFKVLDERFLTPVKYPKKNATSVADLFHKDLKKITDDLNSVILIDDDSRFILHGQRKNFVVIDPTYDYVADYRSRQIPTLKYPPPDRASWLKEQRKLLRILGMVSDATESLKQKPGQTFVSAISALQRDSHYMQVHPFAYSQNHFYTVGAQLVKSFRSIPCMKSFSQD